ncbi:MAG: membrane-bound lytic murein transglycosylase B, partial [Planctomycetota bacterium]
MIPTDGKGQSWSGIVLASLLIFAQVEASLAQSDIPVLEPEYWTIKVFKIFRHDDTPRGPIFTQIVDDLQSPIGAGTVVSRSQFIEILNRLAGEQVYVNELLRYARPKSKEKQNAVHEDYTHIFMKPERIAAGKDFWMKHLSLLEEAQRRFGILPEDLISLLMWESGLGEFTGDYQLVKIYLGQLMYLDIAASYFKSINSDATPKDPVRFEKIKNRAAKNLVSVLREAEDNGIDPLSLKGSWGGAIGYPQFLPMNL